MVIRAFAVLIAIVVMAGTGALAQQAYDACPGLANPPNRSGMSPSASNCGIPGHYKARCEPCVSGRAGVCNGFSAQCCSRYDQKCMEGQ